MKSLNFLLLFFCFGVVSLHAQNAVLTVQGILKKSDGSAVPDDAYTLKFALYNAEFGGTEVWSEVLNNVETNGGLYSALLGLDPGHPLNAPFDVPYYLSVKIGNSSQELLPRPRLSAAPYALSLLGADNIIPSTGNIQVYGVNASHGITAAGNISGYHMTVNADLVVENDTYLKGVVSVTKGILASTGPLNSGTGPFHGYGFLGDGGTGYGSNSGGVASIWAGAQNVLNATNNQVLIRPGGVDVINATNSQITMSQYVHMTGNNVQSYTGSVGQLWSGGVATWGSFSTTGIGLKVDKYILTDGVFAVSDRRIKKDFMASNAGQDLSKLMRLRVTDYKYKDVIGKGDRWKKGFIAQEVEEILPEAVGNNTDIIPDIYALAQNARLEGSTLRLSMEKPHDLNVGDKVRLMAGDHQEELLVQATPSATAFTVSGWTHGAPEKVFVYGREVNDFHSVDYDHLFTLNISATQELARRVESLEKENAAFKAQNDELRQLLEGMRADLDALKGQR